MLGTVSRHAMSEANVLQFEPSSALRVESAPRRTLSILFGAVSRMSRDTPPSKDDGSWRFGTCKADLGGSNECFAACNALSRCFAAKGSPDR
jgi:hypothetical protein